jgi:hypothetical protein
MSGNGELSGITEPLDLNGLFKSATICNIDSGGKAYVGLAHAGCMAAVVIFDLSIGEKPAVIKKSRTEKCSKIAPLVKRMYDENKGITANELAQAVGVDRETVRWCIGLINLEEPGRVCLKSGRAPTAKELVPKVLESMHEDPKYTLSSIARKLEVDRSTVTRAVRIIKQQQSKEI